MHIAVLGGGLFDISLAYYQQSKEGIYLNGRFGSFEYLNMDAVIAQSKTLAENILEVK